ncbi:hypothetical protein GCM10010970_37670 [Silvimonas iriomotensis]|uniref:Uncharacterized protein n=1 Tax=Silvimonas iriomotensis TaxID=449662 RepID=A0ABQ2PES9_9NEIS|nr:hypothetical protein GCM10010970_37670 [Silvimonas iriomotensis]
MLRAPPVCNAFTRAAGANSGSGFRWIVAIPAAPAIRSADRFVGVPTKGQLRIHPRARTAKAIYDGRLDCGFRRNDEVVEQK